MISIHSRSIAMPIGLATIAILLSTAEGFSIPSKAYLSQHHSSSSSLFARPSHSALNFAENDEDIQSYVVETEFKKALETPSQRFFPFPEHQDVDLHGLEQLAPLERQMLRMEGLDPYVLVSVLTSTTSYSTICGTELFPDGHFDLISGILLASSTISAVCGVYATTVFSMCVLYGKTALGLDREDVYYKFMESTRDCRIRGCKAFSTSLLLFLVDIFLIAIDKLPEQAQGPAAILAFATTFFGCKEFIHITKSASPMSEDMIPGSTSENLEE